MHRVSKLLYGTAICLVTASGIANAQDAAPMTKGVIESVVVTAERREQKAQDVPISMSAISGDSMDAMGIRDVASLGQRVPNLFFGPGPTGGENFITMRGLTSANTTNGGDTPVTYSVDGVFFGRSTGVDPEFFDIERVEVLRGPQGTLEGRNSVGGSINVITNKPTDELSGHVDALIGDYNARIFRGWANVPLYECGDCKILARIVGVSANHDAYQKNLSTAPTATYNSDGQDYDMLRAHLLFQFNSDVNLLLSGSQSHSYAPTATKTQWWQYYNPTDLFPGMNRFAGQTWYSDPRKVEKDYPETFEGRQDNLSATFNWDLGFARLTSITGRQKVYMRQANDADATNVDIGHSENWQVSTSQYEQELRLASTDDASPLRWVAGVFYFHEHTEMSFPYSDTGFGIPALTLFGTELVPFNMNSFNSYKTTSTAIYGQVDYDFAKSSAEIPLTITAGLRYTHDHKFGNYDLKYYGPGVSAFTCGFLGSVIVPGRGCVLADRVIPRFDQRFGQVTGKFSVNYKFTPDIMSYATVSRGYMSGGFLLLFYKPQTAWNYEVGLKTQWLDNTLQFNANAFYMDVKKLQVFVQDNLGSRIDNAAGAKMYGVEASLIAIPVEGLRFNLDGVLQNMEYKDYLTDDGRYPGNLIVNNKGNRLLQTPKWTLNAGAEYAIETSMGTITPRVDVFWSSNVYFTAFNSPLAEQPSYALWDFAVKWTDRSQKYQIDVFVKNAFDKDVIASDGLQGSGFGYGLQVDNYTYRAPRTIGARFGVNF